MLALMAVLSCEPEETGGIDIEPTPDPPEVEFSVRIDGIPTIIGLGSETHLYSRCSAEVPQGYRSHLSSSDEKVVRVAEGTTGWDFYVIGESEGSAVLTLTYNGKEARYSVSVCRKVIPTLSISKDYEMHFEFVDTDSGDGVFLTGQFTLSMQGSVSVRAEYTDARRDGHRNDTMVSIVESKIQFSGIQLPADRKVVLADLQDVRRALADGIWSNSWEEDPYYSEGGFYYDYKDEYYPNGGFLSYTLVDEDGRPHGIVLDLSEISGYGWDMEMFDIEQQ